MDTIFLKKLAQTFSLGNAINSLKDDTFNYEHSWDEISYNFNNSNGIKISISFLDEKFILCIQDFSKDNISKYIERIPDFFKELGKKRGFLIFTR